MTALPLNFVVETTPPPTGPRLLIPQPGQPAEVCLHVMVRQRPSDGRYQLVVQSGPDESSPPAVHATYLLPATADFGTHSHSTARLAWQDPYVAVLLHPHALVLHEIVRSSTSSIWTTGGGWTVALPLETQGVWAHPSGTGWLLERVARPSTLALPAHHQGGHATGSSSNSHHDVMRWFTLDQVWEDPLPIRLPRGAAEAEDLDLLWTAATTPEDLWTLTWNPHTHTHTLWRMQAESARPAARPLYEQTRGRSSLPNVSLLWEESLGGQEEEPPMATTTRQEALAHALRLSTGTAHTSGIKSQPPSRRPRPSWTSGGDPLVTSLMHPRWSWQVASQQAAPAAAAQVFVVSGEKDEPLLVLLVPTSKSLYELQYWSLSSSVGSSASATNSHYPSRPCRGAQAVQAFGGRTDLVVWTAEDQLVLFRGGQEALLPYATPTRIQGMADGMGNRLSLHLVDGRWIRAGLAVKSPTPWMERLWQALVDLPLVWALRLDCVRLQGLLVAQHPEISSTSALQILLEVLLELDWQNGEWSRPPNAQDPTEDSWKLLLQSDFHRDFTTLYEDSLCLGPTLAPEPQETSWMRQVYLDHNPLLMQAWNSSMHRGSLATVFDALHLLWQDAQLHVLHRPRELLQVLTGVVRTAVRVNPNDTLAHSFAEQYACYGGDMPEVVAMDLEPSKVTHSTFTCFSSCPLILGWVDDTLSGRKSNGYFDTVEEIPSVFVRTRSIRRIFRALTDGEGPPSTDVRVVEILIEEGIADAANLRETFPTGVSLPLLDILYRCRNSEDISLSQQGWSLVGREDLSRNLDNEEITAPEPPLPEKVSVQSNAEQQDGTEEGKDDDFGDKDNDGLVPLELRSSMLFSGDNRVREAARLVRSSRSIFLKVPRSVEVTDHEFEQLKQKGLALLVQRTLALPIGRGMMTIGGLQPVAAEPLPIPDLCLKGRVPPANASLSLDQTECPAETRIWPEFHNGVAAGLRLPLPGECKETMSRVTRSWIVYNRPLPANQEGNEEANRAAELKQHAHGGFLLALGLRGHLIALEMTDLYEYLTEGTVTTTVGVILGMAANKRGTCDMAISTMLFLHVPSLIPQHFSAIDVASSVQSAAVTGAGLLFQGSSHRMMTEFLLNEIGKRPESDMSAFDREAYTLACGISLGMVNLCVGNSVKAAGIADLRIEERLRRYIEGGEANEDEHRRVRETNDRFSVPLAANGSDNEKCSIVHEGNFINTDLTSPAATMALSFMYMKTGNKTIAATVELPSTHFLLEWVRPDFLGLRVLAKSLILWDDVKASKEWVEDQIPKVVRTAYAEMRERAKRMSLGLAVKGRHTYEYDRKALRQMYVHVLTGACFSIGVRFAGSGDESAKNVLFEYVTMLYKLKEANDPVSVASKPEFPILESCLGQAAMALALVLAGTGDLDALKLFKILRWRHDYDIRFGNHMTYGMAIGLLFLGGGTMTLGRKPDQIAAIVTAFFPRFPMQTGDNQYHLQALRHLYALAVEKREVCAVDVDSGSSIHVPVQFKGIHSGLVESTNVPYLRRNTDSPKSLLTALSDEFYPVTIDLDKINGMTFFVKKRSYVGRDVLSKYDDAPLSKLVKSSTTSPFFLSFAEYFDRVKQADPFLRGHVFDSIARDAEEGLLLYMALSRDFSAKRQSMPSHSFLWDLRLMRSYFAHQRPSKSLLSGELVALFLDRAERILVDQTTQNPEHLRRAQILYDH